MIISPLKPFTMKQSHFLGLYCTGVIATYTSGIALNRKYDVCEPELVIISAIGWPILLPTYAVLIASQRFNDFTYRLIKKK